VLSVDAKAKRIALSIKQLTAPAPRAASKPAPPAPKPQPTMDEKLAALSMKWKVH
jgi:uncharacterized protein